MTFVKQDSLSYQPMQSTYEPEAAPSHMEVPSEFAEEDLPAGQGKDHYDLGVVYAEMKLWDAATGKAGYTTSLQNGTIQRVSADFKTRETFCTGTRFTCALAFNLAGDLFAIEQEGATWLPNGNPVY